MIFDLIHDWLDPCGDAQGYCSPVMFDGQWLYIVETGTSEATSLHRDPFGSTRAMGARFKEVVNATRWLGGLVNDSRSIPFTSRAVRGR